MIGINGTCRSLQSLIAYNHIYIYIYIYIYILHIVIPISIPIFDIITISPDFHYDIDPDVVQLDCSTIMELPSITIRYFSDLLLIICLYQT